MRKLCHIKSIAVLLVITCIFTTASFAQYLRQDEVIASYLYNFAKHITWPEQNQLDAIHIGIYQPINPLLAQQLATHFKGARIHEKPVIVSTITSVKALSQLQLVYIEESHNQKLEQLYEQISGNSVVLITRNHTDKQLVMINLYNTKDNRILFEVNKANILNHGLGVSSDIILNGGTEIDVAALYKEGQASLVKMQKQLRERENRFLELQKGVEKLRNKNERLNSNLRSLQHTIATSQRRITDQNALIDQQKETLKQTNIERERLHLEVEHQTNQLSSRQLQLDNISNEITDREKTLEKLNKTLISQRSRIIELGNTIATQGLILNNLIAIAIFGVILIIVAVWAYINKKRDAEALEERGKDLQIARDKLAIEKVKAEKANQAKSEFLSLMSHELRTPLQAIIGYADVVIEELKIEGLDYTSDLERVINNSERLLRLINSVLDLAKIESGRMDLHLAPVDLEALAADAIANVRPQCDEKQLSLVVKADNGGKLPIADGEKLLHILLNLLGNACKFTDSGSIKLIVAHVRDEIFISVKDTGSGIALKQLPHVFERFQQADSSATRRHQGSGLGLAISKQFCELMGGTISVSSKPQMGTTFTLRIPLPIQMRVPAQNTGGDNAMEVEHPYGTHNSAHRQSEITAQ